MAVTNATMIMGDSGSGKSSLLATLAAWGWKKHKKISLLYSTDGGGFPSKLEALIRAGIVRVWKLRTRGEAFETCSRACQGFWPTEFIDPLAGETLPGVELVKNIVTTFSLKCNKCHTVVEQSKNRRAFQAVRVCPKCGNRVNIQTGTVEESSKVSQFFEDVGIIMFDGLTSMNDWIMSDMADKTGRGELKGETAMGKLISGDMIFGGSTRNHYGYAQIRSQNWVSDATNVQGLVVGPIFTARKQRAVDTNSNVRIYGPQIAGQAKTSDVPAWVGNCLGASTIINEKGQKEWRLYLTEYREPGDEILHLCKTRAAPGLLPDFLSDGLTDASGRPLDGTEPFTNFNLGYFMELLETATTKVFEETMREFPDTPGLGYLERMKEEAAKPPPEPIAKPTAPKPVPKPVPTATKPAPTPITKPVVTKPMIKPVPKPMLKPKEEKK